MKPLVRIFAFRPERLVLLRDYGVSCLLIDDSNGSNVSITKNPGVVSPGVISVNTSQAPGGPTQQNSAPPPSWAAAAGKGLPNNENSSSSGQGGAGASQNITSKHLESLQSVREALFSQDGWGGDNVKQDNAWDPDNKNGTNLAAQDTSQVIKQHKLSIFGPVLDTDLGIINNAANAMLVLNNALLSGTFFRLEPRRRLLLVMLELQVKC